MYCGGFTNGINEELMQKTFSPFGVIQDIRVFKDKGYAFIRFATKESATHAIENIHNTEINGQVPIDKLETDITIFLIQFTYRW